MPTNCVLVHLQPSTLPASIYLAGLFVRLILVIPTYGTGSALTPSLSGINIAVSHIPTTPDDEAHGDGWHLWEEDRPDQGGQVRCGRRSTSGGRDRDRACR